MGVGRQQEKLKVFISYSRRDLAFVDNLQSALKERGIDAAVDRTEIARGEEWWKRIEQLITEADAIVFVLSPGSAGSKICQDEVDFAEKRKKRIVPIVAEDVAELKVPGALAQLNYVFFTPNAAAGATGIFGDALADLVQALETDIGWIREHTRIGGLAQRWQGQGGQGRDLLLRGAELETAERWLA
ncbi:MAG: toll/interleukin-1 receptor domain-containing protein, partial [Hyphomicrobium sp.]